jgi:putative hemolysin
MVALEIILVVLFVLLSGFLAMSELAIVSSRRARLERLAWHEGVAVERLG